MATYRWDRPGVQSRLASHELLAADVPGPLEADDPERLAATSRWVVGFAHTFNGYAAGGGPAQLGETVARLRRAWQETGRLPDDLDTLRAALFYWARADRHAGGTGQPDADDVTWLNALLDAIRRLAS